MVTFATQQDSELRSQYTAELALYPAHTLVLVDKTGADRRDSLRKKAYSICGHPLHTQKLLVRGEHISVIAVMSLQGILALQIVRYSPDYNPIEKCFSKVKSVLKAMEAEMEFCDDIDTMFSLHLPQLHNKIVLDGYMIQAFTILCNVAKGCTYAYKTYYFKASLVHQE